MLAWYHAQILHHSRSGGKTPEIADLRHDRGRGEAIDAAQCHVAFDHRSKHRFGPSGFDLLIERGDPLGHCQDHVDILLEHDLLDRLIELQGFQPTKVGLGPPGLAGKGLPMPEEKGQQPLFGLPLPVLHVLPRPRQVA